MGTQIPAPVAWTVAGSDSGGGAGIQADLKVMSAFGVHGCSIITALTAQNTLGVSAVEAVSANMFKAQLAALSADLPPLAIKTGMPGSMETLNILLDHLSGVDVPLICDPVLKSTSGETLLDRDALTAMRSKLIPRATILTPNLHEVAVLLGAELPIEESANRFLELGSHSVLIKGGHADGSECCDYWTDGQEPMWLSSPRIDTKDSHGTGCILSSAIASAIALGQDIPKAIIMAKTFLNQCLKAPSNVGSGHGPMMIEPFRNAEEDRPKTS